MREKIIPVVPQLFTFGTLIAGVVGIVLAMENHMIWAGIAILTGVVTDVFDGKIARATHTTSDFGLELDSLADIVCFGIGSTIFVYQYLRMNQLPSLASLLIVLPVPLAGVFRLARFNLLPAKTGVEDYTTGLAITSAGGILALAGLSGLHYRDALFPFTMPVIAFIPVMLALLMASRVRFPTLGSVLRRKRTTVFLLGVSALLSFRFTPQLVTFTLMTSYVGFGVVRAGYGLVGR